MADGKIGPETGATSGSRVVDWITLCFVLWFGSYAYMFVFTLGGPKPLVSYFLLLVFTLLFMSGRAALTGVLFRATDKWQLLFLLWLSIYLFYGMTGFLLSSQSAAAVQALISLFEAVLLAAAFSVLMMQPRRVRLVTAGLAMLALFGTAMNVLDFVVPRFSTVPGRAAGFYANPTIAGIFIALAMTGGIARVARPLRLLFVLICGVGVLLTFSRGAWLVWIIGVVCLGWQGAFSARRQRPAGSLLAVTAALGFAALLLSGELATLFATSSLGQYLTPNTAARLGLGSRMLADFSAADRFDLVFYALQEFADAPLAGHGLAYTQEWHKPYRSHNMYLRFLVEGGFPGLLFYAVLMILLWFASTGSGRIVAIQLIFSGLVSHNHLDQPAILIVMAFVVAGGSVGRQDARWVDVRARAAPV
jgi:O-antigen ligase